jgi:hypothetical protein
METTWMSFGSAVEALDMARACSSRASPEGRALPSSTAAATSVLVSGSIRTAISDKASAFGGRQEPSRCRSLLPPTIAAWNRSACG